MYIFDASLPRNQVILLLVALIFSSLIGIERQSRGKSAGIRTQVIVGVTACSMMIVSKYGFMDVLAEGTIRLDPSRVAAQIVSGIGFLGAGIILTRHGTISGLTTAATIWETAAIGMACGAGMWWLGAAGLFCHFTAVWILAPLAGYLHGLLTGQEELLRVTYSPGFGVLRSVVSEATDLGWSVNKLHSYSGTNSDNKVAIDITVNSNKHRSINDLIVAISEIKKVVSVQDLSDT